MRYMTAILWDEFRRDLTVTGEIPCAHDKAFNGIVSHVDLIVISILTNTSDQPPLYVLLKWMLAPLDVTLKHKTRVNRAPLYRLKICCPYMT